MARRRISVRKAREILRLKHGAGLTNRQLADKLAPTKGLSSLAAFVSEGDLHLSSVSDDFALVEVHV